MEMQIRKPKTADRKLKYYSVPAEPRKKVVKPKEFFFIGTDKKVISLLLANFDSGFCSEDLQKGSQMLEMLISRKISLPDVIILQNGFIGAEFETVFLGLQPKIHNIPILVETSQASATVLQQLKRTPFVDDVFNLNENNVSQLLKKITFLKKIKSSLSEANTSLVDELTDLGSEGSVKYVTKKVFDIAVSVISLVLLSPLMLIIAALIKLESKGPVLYCSPRVGKGYRIFKFYKFRTMEVGADLQVHNLYHLNQYSTVCDKKSPLFFKVIKDPRVTRVGKFLRNTSLDELPQLFNVLKGDMSIVGNRPLPLYEAETLTTDEWAKRFLAPAGITGLWQIRKKSNSKMSIEERINLDIDYADNHNFAYDLWILANIPTALIQKDETV